MAAKKISQKPIGPGCDEFDPSSLPYHIALETILGTTPTPLRSKNVKLAKSLGRVLAQDIIATMDVPNHTNSAMDGFAINAHDLNENGFSEFDIVGEAYAGKPYSGEVYSGQAVKIMTGAIMPKGSDTVAMQEYVDLSAGGQSFSLSKAVKDGQNVRQAGEDIQNQSVVFEKGCRIDAAKLGVIASLGIGKVSVFRKPRIATFSNGDEIRQLGSPLQHGEVYDSNRHTLAAMLKKYSVKMIDLGVVGDHYDRIKALMIDASERADVVITSAGASVGEADYIYDILSELGEIKIWKLAIKPGRPLLFGTINNSLFFGLPGNPVSVMTSFALCVKPAIEKRCGQSPTAPLKIKAKTLTNIRKRVGRSEYQRALISRDLSGELVVNARKYQGSGVLSSMALGNCFVVLEIESSGAKAGDWVDVLLFTELY